MRCLWLTLADPDPPLNGQSIYSGGLIRSCAHSGAEVDVLGLCRPGGQPRPDEREGSIRWRFPEGDELPRWSSLITHFPHMANRCRTPMMRTLLGSLLEDSQWDAIVFDSITAGWALPAVRKRYARNGRVPKMVYVSHNHEASLRMNLAENRTGILMRHAQRLDALKVVRLERALIRSSDYVTAITEEDRDRYRQEWPDKCIDVLPPGYSGRSLDERNITGDIPRRAVIVGSFDWIAKRINLEEFLRVADPIFARQGIELQVVGTGEQSYFENLQNGLSATRFTGTVDRVEDYIDGARIALLPERIGGGFKLKLLEYVFNRIPVLALKGSVAGTPLLEDSSVLLFPDQAALARGVSRLIDNLGLLNRLQNAAYAACRNAFDWESRGRQLMSALGSL
jgi:glycosyltransferase involved in cell wall biosynthesis